MMEIIHCFCKYLIDAHVDCMYNMRVSKVAFQINILAFPFIISYPHFLCISFLPVHTEWFRLSESEGHCREKTEVYSQGKSNKWHWGHSAELLALWMHSWAGQFKPLHKDTWLGGSDSTLPNVTTAYNQWHNLYFLSFSVGHNSLAASKRNLTWTSLSKGRSWST